MHIQVHLLSLLLLGVSSLAMPAQKGNVSFSRFEHHLLTLKGSIQARTELSASAAVALEFDRRAAEDADELEVWPYSEEAEPGTGK